MCRLNRSRRSQPVLLSPIEQRVQADHLCQRIRSYRDPMGRAIRLGIHMPPYPLSAGRLCQCPSYPGHRQIVDCHRDRYRYSSVQRRCPKRQCTASLTQGDSHSFPGRQTSGRCRCCRCRDLHLSPIGKKNQQVAHTNRTVAVKLGGAVAALGARPPVG